MKTKYIIAGSAFVAFLFVMTAIFVPNIGSANDEARATTVSYVVESPHYYYNDMDEVYTIHVDNAIWIKAYFYKYDVEKNYDYIYVYDYDGGSPDATYTGRKIKVWTPECAGDTMYIRLVSDSVITKWGFKITQIQYEVAASPDTTAPTVSITAPTNGATVAGTTVIDVTSTDDRDTSPTNYLSIDGGAYFQIGTSYSWDTTTYDNGAHTLKAKAVDDAGNEGFSSLITVTVDNSAPPPLDGDEHFLGAVAGGETDWYEIYAYADGAPIAVSVSWGTSVDIDCYICETMSTSTYLSRGYTTANPETCSYTPTVSKTYYIGVKMYTSTAPSTNYDCHVTWAAEAPPPPPPPSGDKFAIICGISDYKAISDLSYCDEDATDWFNYLKNKMGYATSNMRVYGDGHTANYPQYNGYATEYNYRAGLTWVADNIQAGQTCAFITSGHGSGDGKGSSFLCAWDCSSGESGYDGSFYDVEVDDYVGAIADKGANVFVFIDHCYSGGMGPELMALSAKSMVYCATTCSDNGYGYDDSAHNNGMWTYWFLEAGLIGHFGSSTSTTMEAAFDWASANYPKQPPSGDAPEEYDGNTGATFLL